LLSTRAVCIAESAKHRSAVSPSVNPSVRPSVTSGILMVTDRGYIDAAIVRFGPAVRRRAATIHLSYVSSNSSLPGDYRRAAVWRLRRASTWWRRHAAVDRTAATTSSAAAGSRMSRSSFAWPLTAAICLSLPPARPPNQRPGPTEINGRCQNARPVSSAGRDAVIDACGLVGDV